MIKEIRINYEKYFNQANYWKKRLFVQNDNIGNSSLKKMLSISLLRRYEAKRCSFTGIGKNGECCIIKSPLILPHGLNGIVIARNVIIGENVTVYQHVTIAEEDKTKKTIIGDNVVIGAGAVILNNAKIGNNAKVGANAVVTHDVPDNAVVVGNPAQELK